MAIYWLDDTGNGRFHVPVSAKLLYKVDGEWRPVPGGTLETKRDGLNHLNFPALSTTALRLEVELQPQFSGGILEWQVPD